MLGLSVDASISERPAAVPAPSASLKKTMMGVAIPGIAPLKEGEEPGAPPTQAAPARPAPPANLAQTAQLPVALVPPPAPLADVAPPSPPHIVRKPGVPLAAVALVTGSLVVIGGIVIALLWRSAAPILAQARVSPEGRDVLHLSCEPQSCKDGMVVALGGSQSTFAGGESDLPLATPLRIGDNPLALQVQHPGAGRTETVNVTVPVAYRVRADVSTMSGPKPSITIHVQALAGSDVVVDGQPVPLDASGVGTYSLDETAATEGPADESRVVTADVGYVVTAMGRPAERGTVSARVSIAPLRVDAPGAHAVVEEPQVLLAGRAARGASVTVDGAPVTPGPDGAFETPIDLPAPGERTVAVRAETASLTARTVRVSIKRVASLKDEAKVFERQKTVGYDVAAKNLAASVGQPMVVEGEVIELRGSGHRTLALVDDKRGCAKGPCLVRVVIGRDLPLARGRSLRAWGVIARAFPTAAGDAVPEVEADFVLVPKR